MAVIIILHFIKHIYNLGRVGQMDADGIPSAPVRDTPDPIPVPAPAAGGSAAADRPRREVKKPKDLYVDSNVRAIQRLVVNDRKKDLIGELADWKACIAAMPKPNPHEGVYIPELSVSDSFDTIQREHARVAAMLNIKIEDDSSEDNTETDEESNYSDDDEEEDDDGEDADDEEEDEDGDEEDEYEDTDAEDDDDGTGDVDMEKEEGEVGSEASDASGDEEEEDADDEEEEHSDAVVATTVHITTRKKRRVVYSTDEDDFMPR